MHSFKCVCVNENKNANKKAKQKSETTKKNATVAHTRQFNTLCLVKESTMEGKCNKKNAKSQWQRQKVMC